MTRNEEKAPEARTAYPGLALAHETGMLGIYSP